MDGLNYHQIGLIDKPKMSSDDVAMLKAKWKERPSKSFNLHISLIRNSNCHHL